MADHGTDAHPQPRPSERLDALQRVSRSPSTALAPTVLGTARATRHNFSRSMLRRAAADGWTAESARWDLDATGRGTAIITLDAGAEPLSLVIFSTVLDESERTDRVIASAWDVTAALCRGIVTDERVEAMREHVTAQEDGRADAEVLVWGRANRSARFFDHVVERLAAGQQPDPEVIGSDAYLMRSTAFYGNGKFGLADFDGYEQSHPLAVPYRAQMAAAWLLREFSLDLVEHCARAVNPSAVGLQDPWRRYFGLGNATGLGLVPYVINHPAIFDAWVAMRELPLAHALAATWRRDDPEARRVVQLLDDSIEVFGHRKGLAAKPYLDGPTLAHHLGELSSWLTDGDHSDVEEPTVASALYERARAMSPEVAAVVESLLVELDPSLDNDVEAMLRCAEVIHGDLTEPCGVLRADIASRYGWIEDVNFDAPSNTAMFWYYSAESQEPRRGTRGHALGESVEMPIDVARRVGELIDALADADPDAPVLDVVLATPSLRWAVDRVQSTRTLTYAEAHTNPIAADFLPLDLQRFQLAAYGMDNFSPQSTDWLRVTLFCGAPRVADLATHSERGGENADSDLDAWSLNPRFQTTGRADDRRTRQL